MKWRASWRGEAVHRRYSDWCSVPLCNELVLGNTVTETNGYEGSINDNLCNNL